jgi:hypothetical protein
VLKERWRTGTEAMTVMVVDVPDAARMVYRLHFITMDTGTLLLPVSLCNYRSDMSFYVHSSR